MGLRAAGQGVLLKRLIPLLRDKQRPRAVNQDQKQRTRTGAMRENANYGKRIRLLTKTQSWTFPIRRLKSVS
jgi:hypothetical protein